MNTKPVYACIDLGSNMCRMLVGVQDSSKALGFKVLTCFSSLIYIGKNSKNIDDKGVYRIIKALNKCKHIIKGFDKHEIHVYCVATAIFRSSENADKILQTIQDECGFSFRICMPDEEIAFSAYGCIKSFRNKYSFIIDMGGGSTEIGLCIKDNDQIHLAEWVSLPYGLFYFGKNADSKEIIPKDWQKTLAEFSDRCNKIVGNKKIPFIISRSGIMSTLSKYLTNQPGNKLNSWDRNICFKDAKQAVQNIIKMTPDEVLKNKLTLNKGHLKSMKGSFVFTLEIFNLLEISHIVLNNGGVKEGMMMMAVKGILQPNS